MRPTSKRLAHFLLLTAALNGAAAGAAEYPDFIEQVFLTEEKALHAVFPKGASVAKETIAVSPEAKKRIETRIGWSLPEKSVTVYKAEKDGAPAGYAVISEEIGKFKPITFIVQTGPDGKVENVEVMVYREAVGADVRRSRFTRQFKGKTAKDPLRINRDVLNITGATMSVQAMTAGVKKALVLIDELVLNPGGKTP